jgi:hypothetical protein
MKFSYQMIFFSGIGILCITMYALGYSQKKCPDLTLEPITYVEYPDDALTRENIEAEIKRAKIRFPSIVFKQAMLETGNLRCTNCSLNKNNLFGFQRDSSGYLCFETWVACIYKYKSWQEKNWDSTKYDNYYQCLEKKWGADSTYVKRLMQF